MEIVNSIQEEAVQPWRAHGELRVYGTEMLYRESSTLLDLTHHGNTALEISMRVFLERYD